MSVVDGTITSGAVVGGTNVTLGSVVVDAGHNALLAVFHSGTNPAEISAVSWNGVNFTRVVESDDGNSDSVDVWIGVGLTPGTASLTFTSIHALTFGIVCISYGGVSVATPTGTPSIAISQSNLNNAAVATTAGGYLIGCGVAEVSAAFTAQNGQTQLFDSLFGAAVTVHVGKQTAAGTSTQDRYTISPTHFAVLTSFQINAAPAATTSLSEDGYMPSAAPAPGPVIMTY